MNKILFLCTGNYYRSRFSEEYFNHFSSKQQMGWLADSLGIQRVFSGNGNVGPIAQNTLNYLEKLDIKPTCHQRMPKRVNKDDFAKFDRVVAVSLDEHKPMLEHYFVTEVLSNIEYFDVEDLHIEGPETALPRLVAHLDTLLAQLTRV